MSDVRTRLKFAKEQADKINNCVALRVTLAVGTMWTAYLFAILVLIPLIFPTTQLVVMYISSSFLQLILLPLIMVGTNVTGAKAEARAEEDHLKLIAEFEEIKQMHAELHQVVSKLSVD